MEAWVVVALEERKSIRVPGWLLERQSVAGGIPESVCVWVLRGGSLLEYQVLFPNVWVSAGEEKCRDGRWRS